MATCSREGFQSFGVASSLSTERTFRGRGPDGDWNTQDKAARVGIGLTLVFVLMKCPPLWNVSCSSHAYVPDHQVVLDEERSDFFP